MRDFFVSVRSSFAVFLMTRFVFIDTWRRGGGLLLLPRRDEEEASGRSKEKDACRMQQNTEQSGVVCRLILRICEGTSY